MSVFEQIDILKNKGEEDIRQKQRKRKLAIYLEGLKAKIIQADYALARISTYEDKTDDTVTQTTQAQYLISDKVNFYCDSFWTFLYSSLDVLGQVVNQTLRLNLDEKEVSFKRVKSKLDNRHRNTRIQQLFDQCSRSRAFKNLDRYRNCSTHRRQIYILEETRLVRHTAGYDDSTTTGPKIQIVRLLCDNPLVLNPKLQQNKSIPGYMEDTLKKTLFYVEEILKSVNIIP